MKITHDGKTFVAQSSYAEKDTVKSAGFRWDPKERRWWTADPVIAARLAEYADEKARVVMSSAEQSAVASRATDSAVELPCPDGLAYLRFQKAGIAYAMGRPSTLFGDEMGLGKTIEAIGVINASPEIQTVLVVCPASLKLNWRNELQKWLVRPFDVRVINGKAWPAIGNGGSAVRIINYDVLDKHLESIQAVQWDLLIVDEVHYVKNPRGARRAQIVVGYDEKADDGTGTMRWRYVPGLAAKRRLFLTGTPVPNRPVELFPIVRALDPERWMSFFAFARRYCNAVQSDHGWDFNGASHLDELQAKLRATVMVRRLKADVLTELPAKRRQIVTLAPTSEQLEILDEERGMEAEYDRIPAAMEQAKAVESDGEYEQAVGALRQPQSAAFEALAVLAHRLALSKVPQVLEWVHDVLAAQDKVVVFAHHRDVVEAIAAEFGSEAVILYGGMSPEEKDASVVRFQTDPSCRVFVGGIMAAGLGITLTAASTVVFAELDWVPGNMTQAEDRLHRIGQHDPVLVQHLVIDGSLDARKAAVIIQKQRVIDKALDKNCEVVVQAVEPGVVRSSREQITAIAATLTKAQVLAVHQALRLLAGLDQDHASQLNEAGFNRLDTYIGHDLAKAIGLSPRQAALGLRIVRKYRRQLPDELVKVLELNGKESDAESVE